MLPGLQSFGYWDAAADQTWGTGWTCIESLVVGFIGRGRLDCSVGDQAHSLKSGHLFIVRPGQPHCLGGPYLSASRLHWILLDLGVRQSGDPWRWPSWVILSNKELDRLTLLLRGNTHPFQHADLVLRRCFEQMVTWIPQLTAIEAETRIKIWANTMLLELLRVLETIDQPLTADDTTIRRTVETFLRSLPDHVSQPWCVDSMASHCGLGRSRFAFYCEELTNLSPIKYLIRCRLGKAARLLLNDPERNITTIAFECGFQSSQYFTTAFHHSYGCAPTNYRQGCSACGPAQPTLPTASLSNLHF